MRYVRTTFFAIRYIWSNTVVRIILLCPAFLPKVLNEMDSGDVEKSAGVEKDCDLDVCMRMWESGCLISNSEMLQPWVQLSVYVLGL